MDSSDINEDKSLGSKQLADNSINVEDDNSDVAQGSSGSEELRSEATAADTNVTQRHLRSRTITLGNDYRKRKSQSSYPVAEKVSGVVWKVEPQPQEENLPVPDSEVRKIKAEPSGVPKVECTQRASGGEESRDEATVADTNVTQKHLRSRTITFGNDNRKRKSQSSYPVAEKVSGVVWKAEPRPEEENLPVPDSEVRKIKTEPSSVPKVECTQRASGGEESRDEATAVDTNVIHEQLRSLTITSGNDNRERRSQSSYPVAEKVSGFVWKAEPEEPQEENLPVQDSTVRKIKTEPSSFPSAETVPHAKSNKAEPRCVQCPVKNEDGSGTSSSNNYKGDSNANISSASTSTGVVGFVNEVMNPTPPLRRIDAREEGEILFSLLECALGLTEVARAPGARNVEKEAFLQSMTSTGYDDIKIEALVGKPPFSDSRVLVDFSNINKSTLKTSAGASSSTNDATVPEARTIKREPTSADASSSTTSAAVPDARTIKSEPTSAGAISSTSIATEPGSRALKHEPTSADASRSTNVEANIKNESNIIQRPVKHENESGMSLNNDGKNNSEPNISSASTSSEEVEILEEHAPQEQSSLIEYLYQNTVECPICNKRFYHEILMEVHIRVEHID